MRARLNALLLEYRVDKYYKNFIRFSFYLFIYKAATLKNIWKKKWLKKKKQDKISGDV